MALLEHLKTHISPKDLRLRAKAFVQTERFIQNASQGGGVGPMKKTFLVRGTKDIRVDIEVQSGMAFVP